MASDGNREKMVSELKARDVEWGSKIRQEYYSRKESWTALYSNISVKIKYHLPACN